MKTIGRHLIAEYYDCQQSRLDDLDGIREQMLEAARVVGATILGECFHTFSPQGVSGTVVIAESHLSIHTWPECGYAAVDIYTCGGLDPRRALEFLGQQMEASTYRMQEIVRGLPHDRVPNEHLLPDDVQIISRVAPVRRVQGVGGKVSS